VERPNKLEPAVNLKVARNSGSRFLERSSRAPTESSNDALLAALAQARAAHQWHAIGRGAPWCSTGASEEELRERALRQEQAWAKEQERIRNRPLLEVVRDALHPLSRS
jgi:hypothetical protein